MAGKWPLLNFKGMVKWLSVVKEKEIRGNTCQAMLNETGIDVCAKWMHEEEI